MANFEAWIADCHLKEFEGDGEYKCQAAVWADCYDTFRGALVANLQKRGLGIVWLEEVLPAGQYLAQHGAQHQKIGDLTRAVHHGNLVEIRSMTALKGEGYSISESYLTITEHKFEPLPDQSKLPFWDQEWIASGLKDLLFGQPDDGPSIRTYFVVDAALRKNITGVFDLDNIDAPIRCLFKGDASEELKETAPYLIDMTLPDGAWDDREKLPAFHKDFFKRHWGQNTGIFIRTTALMDDVWGHFRKFTRVQVEEDKRWVFFRFWDTRIAPFYFDAVRHIPERSIHWARLRNGKSIHTVIGNKKDDQAWCITPEQDLFGTGIKASSLTLSDVEIEAFIKYKRESYVDELLPYFKEKDPFHANTIGDDGVRNIVRLGIDRAAQYGLTHKSPVKLYIHLMFYLGSYFDVDPMLPWANSILTSEKYEGFQTEKANALRDGLIKYLEAVSGQKGEYLQSFMKSCQMKLNAGHPRAFSDDTLSFIKSNYPQKVRYVGDEFMSRLIEHSGQICKSNELHEGRSVLLLSCLRLIYGTQIIEDPLFPWMKKIFEAQKTNKDAIFHKVTKKFMDEVIQYVERVQ